MAKKNSSLKLFRERNISDNKAFAQPFLIRSFAFHAEGKDSEAKRAAFTPFRDSANMVMPNSEEPFYKILRYCKTKSVLQSLTGFTLIELALVSFLILLIIAGAVPLFRNTFRNLEFNNAALNIVKLIRYGQERAIVEGNTFKIKFNFEKKTYQLLESDNAVLPGFKNIKNERFGVVFRLPENVNIESKGGTDEIFFEPNGGTSIIALTLTSGNESLSITTSGKAGNVFILKNESR